MPYRFTMREFAFVYFDSDGMHRPVAFNTKKEAQQFLKEKAPLHSYYSTAYYSNPGVPMAEKEWLGADLVFDLDADHIPGSEELNYIEQLEKVKEKCSLLIEEFLINDFGFEREELDLFFSGHRGYHVHVKDSKIFELSSQGRREIVDYITGKGLSLDVILPSKNIKVGEYKEIDNLKKTYQLPLKKEGGWRKKTRKLTIDLLERWHSMRKEKVIEEMQEKHGVGSKTAEGLYHDLFEKEKWKRVIEDNTLDVFSEEKRGVNSEKFRKIIEGILEEENVREIGSKIIGSTDEPVTGDTKRLIRLPRSIHGGSFMKVERIDIDELEDFYPLRDAILGTLREKEFELIFQDLPKIEEIEIKDSIFEIKEEMSVPEYAVPTLITKFGAKLL